MGGRSCSLQLAGSQRSEEHDRTEIGIHLGKTGAR